MLEEFRSEVLINRVLGGQLQRHRQHRGAVERHPGRGVGLLQRAAGRQRLGAVEHTDVVEPEETAGEEIVAFGVLAVHPPGEVEQQLLENAFEECAVAFGACAGHLVSAPRGPGMDRRIDIVKGEFVGRQLAVRVHVPFAQQQHELVFGKLRIQPRERDHVKRQVPRCIPRIFPLVRHGNHIAVVEMAPVTVAPLPAAGRRRGFGRIALEPVANAVMIKLFRPEQSRISLPRHAPFLVREKARDAPGVKGIGLANPIREPGAEIILRRFVARKETQTQRRALARLNFEAIMGGRLRADACWVDRLDLTVNDEFVECVLHERMAVRRSKKFLRVGLVVCEQPFRSAFVRTGRAREMKMT